MVESEAIQVKNTVIAVSGRAVILSEKEITDAAVVPAVDAAGTRSGTPGMIS